MRLFAATPRYLQGAGVLAELGPQARQLGMRALLVADAVVLGLLAPRLQASCAENGPVLDIAEFAGEVTHAEIAALARGAREFGADLVIGAGGGKALDAAKGVARALDLRMVSVPTVASNDGPASASIAVYDEQHLMVDILQMKRNPDLVLVDTAVIAAAPLRFFLAGIGDALSKKFEAEACHRAGAATLFGAEVSFTGMAAADACYRVLREHAPGAVRQVAQGKVDACVEAVIEATVLLSTISFENGGLSIAHAIARGFSHLPRAAGTLHGEHVGYGLLVQLVLERRDDAVIDELLCFYGEIGLPSRLADFLRAAPTADELRMLAQCSMASPSAARFTPKVDAGMLEAAIAHVEKLQS